MSKMNNATCTVSDYLMDRLVEWGIDRIFGVPGDYTLSLLDHVVEHPQIAWTGCTNELNAGYAADGYGRMRGGAALLTTFGVGELSALNALAGSFAEHVPVLHIVGSPALGSQAAHRIVHHSLGDGVFTHFIDMHANITCASAALSAENACDEIDRVLAAIRDQRLPGYLLIPADVAVAPVDHATRGLPALSDHTDGEALEAFFDAARDLLKTASNVGDVTVLAGLLAHRVGALVELSTLLEAGPLVHATTLWGKSVVDESNSYFAGIYAGAASDDAVQLAVEEAPVLITVGVQFTDLNSGFFTQSITRRRTIEIGSNAVSVGSALFFPVSLASALRVLTPLVKELPPTLEFPSPHPSVNPDPPAASSEDALTQSYLWDAVARFFRPGDIVLADQGCSFYGAATHRLPPDVVFIGQPLWASIGYTLPAMLGACLADPERRGVLLIGDGAAQMTVQELSTIFRLEVAAVVIVLDNDGYTVERAIHGPDQPYNDIPTWDWTMAPDFLAPQHPAAVFRVASRRQLDEALESAGENGGAISIIQAVVGRMDVPELLTSLARSASAANARRD
jgi:alpha-keto-acid decarboxylase